MSLGSKQHSQLHGGDIPQGDIAGRQIGGALAVGDHVRWLVYRVVMIAARQSADRLAASRMIGRDTLAARHFARIAWPTYSNVSGSIAMVKPREVTWSDVKTALAQFDRTGLLALLKDMHALRPENRAFLAARLGVGNDPLTPYKRVISRWVYPDLIRGQDVSVAKAKKAIAEYRKAIGRPEGLAELSIYYTEEAARLIVDCGMEDEAYYSALVRMFEQGLAQAIELPATERNEMLERLDAVRVSLRGVGWGVSDAVNEIWHDRVD